jgi:hypothetical protein
MKREVKKKQRDVLKHLFFIKNFLLFLMPVALFLLLNWNFGDRQFLSKQLFNKSLKDNVLPKGEPVHMEKASVTQISSDSLSEPVRPPLVVTEN